jgi:transcription initiation factor TFIID subunit 2
MQYIRKVHVVQEKRNNWLFQLLREKDIIGQIEAVHGLTNFNEELVYEILKTVARNENYFVKVRKEVLKALGKMEISTFNEHISHEMFLLKFFDRRAFDEESGFYKPNNFRYILEYFMDKALVKAIAKCKENKIKLLANKQSALEKYRENQQSKYNNENSKASNSRSVHKQTDNDQTFEIKSDGGGSHHKKSIKLARTTQLGGNAMGGGLKKMESQI